MAPYAGRCRRTRADNTDQLISVWKDGLTSDRKEGVRHITSVNEQDGLPFTMKLVFSSSGLLHLLLLAVMQPNARFQALPEAAAGA
jgi:hypothetical protein